MIKGNNNIYDNIKNYLEGDPRDPGFLECLSNLETRLANYLIEILNTENENNNNIVNNLIKILEEKNPNKNITKSDIYSYITGPKGMEYISNEEIEKVIVELLLGHKKSIQELLDLGEKRIEDLLNTETKFLTTIRNNINQLNGTIIQTGQPPISNLNSNQNSSTNLPQNLSNPESYKIDKLILFLSILEELNLFNDTIKIYSGTVDNNIRRKSTYYAIYIPKVNKTVFLNTGYGEASFVCEGEFTAQEITTISKETLKTKKGYKRIRFNNNNIYNWKLQLQENLVGKLGNLKIFYDKHKDKEFIDSGGNKVYFKTLFEKSIEYYKRNYRSANKKLREYGIKYQLPMDPTKAYGETWNRIKQYLEISKIREKQTKIMKLEELIKFFQSNKDTFTDSDGNKVEFQKLFETLPYYQRNYSCANRDLKISLPENIIQAYGKTWNNIKKILGITEIRERQTKIMTLEELKEFFKSNKDTFTDSDGNKVEFQKLFETTDYYKENYKNANRDLKINLPKDLKQTYGIPFNKIKDILGIQVDNRRERINLTFDNLKQIYINNKYTPFIDSDQNKVYFKTLFEKSIKYYRDNYKKVAFIVKLPSNPMAYFKMSWEKIKEQISTP